VLYLTPHGTDFILDYCKFGHSFAVVHWSYWLL